MFGSNNLLSRTVHTILSQWSHPTGTSIDYTKKTRQTAYTVHITQKERRKKEEEKHCSQCGLTRKHHVEDLVIDILSCCDSMSSFCLQGPKAVKPKKYSMDHSKTAEGYRRETTP